ncbi:MAG: hypothetical protein AUJ88_03460 [Gallionellaceae bacterium CG1_02_56_997]|nr:MAG: hypothetical protein AUJ88_03460 [Gallionellaceae bacterium CG1_02_56_997]
MQNQISSTIEILLARFHGQVLVPFVAGAECVGIPEQTARNKLSKGEFPIQTVLTGSRRQIHIQDLAAYVDNLREQSVIKKPKLGRRTKASKFAAASYEAKL